MTRIPRPRLSAAAALPLFAVLLAVANFALTLRAAGVGARVALRFNR